MSNNLTSQQSVLTFDGKDDYLLIPNQDTINFSKVQNFCIELWLKVGTIKRGKTTVFDVNVFEKWRGSSFPYAIRYSSSRGTIYGSRYDGKNPSVSSKKVVNDKKFHHIAFVKQDSQLILYVDGVEESKTKDTVTKPTQNNSDVYIASGTSISKGGGTRRFFAGQIADLRIWNLARTPEEIKANMNSRLTGNEPGLVGYYPLNGDANDKTSNGNNGTINGATWQEEELPIQDSESTSDSTTEVVKTDPEADSTTETETIWKIGNSGEIGTGSPQAGGWKKEVTYVVGSDQDPVNNPSMPFVLVKPGLSPKPKQKGKPIPSTDKLNIRFTLERNYDEGELTLSYNFFGSETDTLSLDGKKLITIVGVGEGKLKQSQIPLGALSQGEHTLTLTTDKGNGSHWIDYLQLVGSKQSINKEGTESMPENEQSSETVTVEEQSTITKDKEKSSSKNKPKELLEFNKGFSHDEAILMTTISNYAFEFFEYDDDSVEDEDLKAIYQAIYKKEGLQLVHTIRNDDTNIRGLILKTTKSEVKNQYVVSLRGTFFGTKGSVVSADNIISDFDWKLIDYGALANQKAKVVQGVDLAFQSVADEIKYFFKTLRGDLKPSDFRRLHKLEPLRQFACITALADAGAMRLGTEFEQEAQDLIEKVVADGEVDNDEELEQMFKFLEDQLLSNLSELTETVEVWVTGFSLGAALSQVTGLALRRWFGSVNSGGFKIKVYAIASPKIGNQDFIDFYNEQMGEELAYRVENALDIVPTYPYDPPFPISAIAPEGFQVGNVFLGKYGNGGEAIRIIGMGDGQSASLSIPGLSSLPFKIPFPHSPEVYLKLLEDQKEFFEDLARPIKSVTRPFLQDLINEEDE